MGSRSSPRCPDVQQAAESSDDDEFFCDFQLFDEHGDQAERFRKTMYYGELPWYSERPSLALTSLALEFFVRSLPPRDELRYLDMDYASRVMRNACVTPASVVLAMVYADRLRSTNPQYLAQANSCDLFIVSMMVASKFLYDDGVDDEVYNGQWAKAADLELTALNRQERLFLGAINWNLFVRPAEYGTVLGDIERRIALRELAKRQRLASGSTTSRARSSSTCCATFTELHVLTSNPRALSTLYRLLCDYVLKVTAVSLVSYCACLLTVAASVAAVNLISLVAKPAPAGRATVSSTSPAPNANSLSANVSCGEPTRVSTLLMASRTTHGSRPSYACATLSPRLACPRSSPTYSAPLLEHQKELRSILRGEVIMLLDDLVETLPGSGTSRSTTPFAQKGSSVFIQFDGNSNNNNNNNDSIYCLRNPAKCLLTDQYYHAPSAFELNYKATPMDIRFWELWKQEKISPQLAGASTPFRNGPSTTMMNRNIIVFA